MADEPKFLQAARAEAERTGVTAEQVLEADVEALAQSTYPTDDCLDDEEFTDIVKGVLPHARYGHLEECASCNALARTKGWDGIAQ